MVSEVLQTLPGWLLQGVLLGIALSLGVAGLFYLLVRRFPGGGETDGRLPSGEARRREEIRHYLDTIGEQYAEEYPVHGQTVAFYLPERDVAITFDARTYYRLARADTVVVLVEHELPGLHLGARLPFETPEIDLDAESNSEVDPRDAAFAVLGLPAGADIEEVKRAYRVKVKEVHPDHGGNRDEFERVREAYTTAKEHAG